MLIFVVTRNAFAVNFVSLRHLTGIFSPTYAYSIAYGLQFLQTIAINIPRDTIVVSESEVSVYVLDVHHFELVRYQCYKFHCSRRINQLILNSIERCYCLVIKHLAYSLQAEDFASAEP